MAIGIWLYKCHDLKFNTYTTLRDLGIWLYKCNDLKFYTYTKSSIEIEIYMILATCLEILITLLIMASLLLIQKFDV